MKEKIVFVADSHILHSNPQTLEKFCNFLKNISDKTSSIYFLGDIFEYWIGEEKIFINKYESLLKNLRTLSTKGVFLYFIPGNRDYLLGKKFGMLTGANILKIQAQINLNDNRTLITHGDFIFNKSPIYTLYRAFAQLYPVSNAFLHLPAPVKSLTAMFLRNISKKQKRQPELNKDMVFKHTRKFFERGIDILICAHIHLQKTFEFEINNKLKRVFILGHFELDGSYLEYDGKFNFRKF